MMVQCGAGAPARETPGTAPAFAIESFEGARLQPGRRCPQKLGALAPEGGCTQ